MSGRVADIAVHPTGHATWVMRRLGRAVADRQLGYDLDRSRTDTALLVGCVTFDAKPQTVWAGSGRTTAQRSVGYGDGVYKSGRRRPTFKNVGLKESDTWEDRLDRAIRTSSTSRAGPL